MSVWRVPVDLLAGSRFVISPMTDTVAALKALHSPRHPWQHSWRRPHLAAYQRMLARRPAFAHAPPPRPVLNSPHPKLFHSIF